LVKKPVIFCDIEIRKEKNTATKNQQLRDILKVYCQNQIKWRYALAESWFSSAENMQYIHHVLENTSF